MVAYLCMIYIIFYHFFGHYTGGVDVNMCNSHGQTPLYLAAKKGEADLVKSLIAAGGNINYVCKEEGCYTPLIIAAANEHKAVVSLLTKVKKWLLHFLLLWTPHLEFTPTWP